MKNPLNDLTLPDMMRCTAMGLVGVMLPAIIGTYLVPAAGGLFIVIAVVSGLAGFIVGGKKVGS